MLCETLNTQRATLNLQARAQDRRGQSAKGVWYRDMYECCMPARHYSIHFMRARHYSIHDTTRPTYILATPKPQTLNPKRTCLFP